MRWRLVSALLVAAALTFAGCRGEASKIEFDEALIEAEIGRRAEHVLAGPALEKSVGDLVEAAFGDPEVGKSGEKVLAALGNDPALQPGFEAILGELQKQPAMTRLVQRLVREHPTYSSDQIGELAGARIEGVTNGPEFDKAFGQVFDRVMERPLVSSKFDLLGDKIGNNPHIVRMLSGTIDGAATEATWRKRVLELGGGKAPDKKRATELLLDHTFSNARLERFYARLFSLPVMKRELARTAHEMLEAPSFTRHAVRATRALVEDADFQRHAVDAIAALVEDEQERAPLSQALGRPLECAAFESALSSFLQAVTSDPELGAIGDRALARIAADPELKKVALEFATAP